MAPWPERMFSRWFVKTRLITSEIGPAADNGETLLSEVGLADGSTLWLQANGSGGGGGCDEDSTANKMGATLAKALEAAAVADRRADLRNAQVSATIASLLSTMQSQQTVFMETLKDQQQRADAQIIALRKEHTEATEKLWKALTQQHTEEQQQSTSSAKANGTAEKNNYRNQLLTVFWDGPATACLASYGKGDNDDGDVTITQNEPYYSVPDHQRKIENFSFSNALVGPGDCCLIEFKSLRFANQNVGSLRIGFRGDKGYIGMTEQKEVFLGIHTIGSIPSNISLLSQDVSFALLLDLDADDRFGYFRIFFKKSNRDPWRLLTNESFRVSMGTYVPTGTLLDKGSFSVRGIYLNDDIPPERLRS